MVLALAQSENIQFERSKRHLLDFMISALPDSNPFKAMLGQVSWLEAYATTYRYPKPSGRLAKPPSDQELADALRIIEDTLRGLVEHFGVNVNVSDGLPATNSKPPRR